MTEAEERTYSEGSRAAWRQLFQLAARNLGYDKATNAALAQEREQAIAVLREVCREFGDNDWPNDLCLADIIDKHLARHLYENQDTTEGDDE